MPGPALFRLIRPRGFLYLEVKNRADQSPEGPPFHISREMVEECFGACGVAIVKDFGKQPAPYGPSMTQVAYMMQKK